MQPNAQRQPNLKINLKWMAVLQFRQYIEYRTLGTAKSRPRSLNAKAKLRALGTSYCLWLQLLWDVKETMSTKFMYNLRFMAQNYCTRNIYHTVNCLRTKNIQKQQKNKKQNKINTIYYYWLVASHCICIHRVDPTLFDCASD